MAASWSDEGLATLIGDGGMAGLARYGLWWRTCEIIADQMAPDATSATVRYPVTRWSHLLSLRGSLVFSTLSTLEVTGGVTVERDDSGIRVTIPNLLKYRDEYSRKSGHTTENVPSTTDTEQIQIQKNNKYSSSELKTPSLLPQKILGTLPLNDRSDFEITEPMVLEWGELFPALDVKQQCRSMKAWCIANPTKRKTRKGILKFITGWLDREQNKAPAKNLFSGNGATNGKPATTLSDDYLAAFDAKLAHSQPDRH